MWKRKNRDESVLYAGCHYFSGNHPIWIWSVKAAAARDGVPHQGTSHHFEGYAGGGRPEANRKRVSLWGRNQGVCHIPE